MSEPSARKNGNPVDVQVRDAQRLKGLSSLEEREAASIMLGQVERRNPIHWLDETV